ncbi:hypothetical protein ATZ36_17890 [Candidatus Endomicrobiellum trichonymphae]|uniref:Uncharacterized protein n=1 Tax=Endomicrobium trichonymphae TaxID=1408204 RepID=A0A1E5ILJ2_ENDTX|nr:hypothetical protein ATZ36_17890 [Candidatus Endomicrobium trichonymphae]
MDKIYEVLERVRKISPLIHHKLDYSFRLHKYRQAFRRVAIWPHAPEEAANMTSISNAVVINMELSTTTIRSKL